MRMNDGLDRKERLMEYTKLGNTDIEVSKLCVGCMSFGQVGLKHDWTLDRNQTEEMIKHALDLGINFLIRRIVIPQEPVKSMWDQR